MSSSNFTFLFYDYETFGKNPSLDRPAQFASLRTDLYFNIYDEEHIFYCKPASDYLPQPEAVLLTGITPQKAITYGVTEAVFAKHIYGFFTKPQTCIVGYNNLQFDDEITRNIFYRNFYDPYSWSWQNHNSRWDLLNVMRACYALRPEGIVWPKNNNGFPSFKLKDLTKANNIIHRQQHDAMSDVYATKSLAKLVKNKQPKLFDFLFTYRNKKKLISLIDITQMKPLVHISSIFGASCGNTSWISPIAWHPNYRNILIIIDLASDITELLALKIDKLIEKIYTYSNSSKLDMYPKLPIKLVNINKCPIFIPANILNLENANRLNISRQHCLDNLNILLKCNKLRDKIINICTAAAMKPCAYSDNVDTQLYNGFFSNTDRAKMQILRQTSPQNLSDLNLKFEDQRISKLLFLYRARNFPKTLNINEQYYWQQHRYKILNPKRMQTFFSEIESLKILYKTQKEKIFLLKELDSYAQTLLL
ncbi:exodeoxyribonuclease I [Pantoea sp. Mhis]|uniref:exodeoxyribonuclease I n=1 Tax=Pantoea sp. Mhis TaxID=2576759 RepID=UPI001357BCA5|nr:exodeoxyribonuclease I [Pantoea sp. Mhis]MXP56166.1 exodeoxyribonuclease I [Pantoea sp. Mhis]